MALSDNAICTLDDVKEYYGITSLKADDDDFVESLIDNITDLFESYCGVDSFIAQDYTEYYDGKSGIEIFPKNIPINSVVSIYDDQDWVWDASSKIDSSYYRIQDKLSIVLNWDWITKGRQNIKLTYNAGYSTIPGDLKLVCIEEVIRRYKNRRDLDVTIKSLRDGSKTTLGKELMPNTMLVLSKYQRKLGF